MKSYYDKMYIGDASSITFPQGKYIDFTDEDHTRICLNVRTILRLHSIIKLEVERSGKNFDEYCAEVCK